MALENERFMALALDIQSLMSSPDAPANRAYLSSGGSRLDLQLSRSDQVSVLCLALSALIRDEPDYEGAVGRIVSVIRGNVSALKQVG